jgi:NTP pyrophosphatase (non-canonical NTP hydrolase)
MNKLTFAVLRQANLLWLPLFKNAKGRPAHSQPDGSDWSKPEWCNAVLGELGELANLLKKVQRGDMTMDEARPAIGKELADVQTYLDILAFQCGVDLGDATVEKFNEVSDRVDCGVFIVPTEGNYNAADYMVRIEDTRAMRTAAMEAQGTESV